MVANIEEVLQRGEALSGKYTWLPNHDLVSIIVIYRLSLEANVANA